MITEIVTFEIPADMDREHVLSLFEESAKNLVQSQETASEELSIRC